MAEEKKANEITSDEIRESLKRLEAKIRESSTNSAWLGLVFMAGSIIVASVSWTSSCWRIIWIALAIIMTVFGELMLWKPWRKNK